MTMEVSPIARPALKADEALNDSDKTFTVVAGTFWDVEWIWVELVTTSTAGNRQLAIEVQDDAGDVIMRLPAGATQAASKTENYLFGKGVEAQTSPADNVLQIPLPVIVLPGNYVIRVYDTAAIAAAADDMVVQMLVRQWGDV